MTYQIRKNDINIESLFFRILRNWYWIVSFSLFGFFIGYLLNNHWMPKMYKNNIVISVNSVSSHSQTPNGSINFFWGQTSANEVTLVKKQLLSRTHNERLVMSLKLYTKYYLDGQLIDKSQSPIEFRIDEKHDQLVYHPLKIVPVSENSCKVIFPSKEKEEVHYNYYTEVYSSKKCNCPSEIILNYNQPFKSGSYAFSIKKNPKVSFDNELEIKLFPTVDVAFEIINSLEITNDPDLKTILIISKTGYNLSDITNFLNKSIGVLNNLRKEDKNLGNRNTISYIKEQLKNIKIKLDSSAKEFQTLKKQEKIFDLDSEIKQALEDVINLEKQKSLLQVKLRGLYQIKNAVNGDISQLISLSFFDIDDPNFLDAIRELKELDNQRQSKQLIWNPNNPQYQKLENEIEKTRKKANNIINSYINNLSNEIFQINTSINEAEYKLENLPLKEQKFLNAQRTFMITDNLYSSLLNRLIETELAIANTQGDIVVIDKAKNLNQPPISPNRRFNFLLPTLILALIPTIFITVIEVFDLRIKSVQQFRNMVNAPVVGVIGLKKTDSNLSVLEKPSSIIAESFRSLAANLRFIYPEKEIKGGKTILITSSIGGEGKTFVSINLASVLSLSGKKTILVGMDLRKPKIFNDFQVKNEIGMSNYLAGDAKASEIILSTSYKNLSIIVSGPVPPNPYELLISHRLQELFQKLRKDYDFIVIDSPPIAIVIDALDLTLLSDVNLYVCRHRYTQSNLLTFISEKYGNKEIKNLGLVYNAYEKEGPLGYGYGYGYVYGYGYGYGYYREDKETFRQKVWRKFLSKFVR